MPGPSLPRESLPASLPEPLSLEQINRLDRETGGPLQGLVMRVRSMLDLFSELFSIPPGPGYQTARARRFTSKDFIQPFLNTDEMVQLNRFKVLKKQLEWCCGRFALKHLLQTHFLQDLSLPDIRINTKDEGAPYAEGCPDICLSLSHSRDMTAAALSLRPGLTLGLDIEAISTLPDQAFMKTAFTAREIQAMDRTPAGVFRMWTLKEAYLKYIQRGFNESLHQVEVLGDRIFHRGKETGLKTVTWQVETGYMLSLVRDPV